jgi:hypothetical protein
MALCSQQAYRSGLPRRTSHACMQGGLWALSCSGQTSVCGCAGMWLDLSQRANSGPPPCACGCTWRSSRSPCVMRRTKNGLDTIYHNTNNHTRTREHGYTARREHTRTTALACKHTHTTMRNTNTQSHNDNNTTAMRTHALMRMHETYHTEHGHTLYTHTARRNI